jgi:hypothetical protein
VLDLKSGTHRSWSRFYESVSAGISGRNIFGPEFSAEIMIFNRFY